VIDRRTFIDAIAGGLLAPALPAWTQPAGKVWRIGMLRGSPSASPASVAWDEAFKQVLRERGYVEGKNLAYETRYIEGRVERAPELAAELVSLNVDLIVVTTGSTAVLAAREATKTIPIVMTNAANPVEFGLIDSLARPGGNVTGVAYLLIESIAKRLGLLKEAVPSIKRVSHLRGVGTRTRGFESVAAAVTHGGEVAAKALGITMAVVEISASQSFDDLAEAIHRERPDALSVASHPLLGLRSKEIAEIARNRRLPTVAAARGYVDSGMLMSYAENYVDMARKAAMYVVKILGGAKPADLPVEQPTKFELVINLKTAKVIGLTIPKSVLLRADEVIE
jgi:putative tryptophan/tyrosine transport system substrate-binding protein